MGERLELPQGTLDLLILKTLALEPLHGWAVSERLGQISREAFQVGQGSLYPALHRLERRGWIRATWGVSENHRKARYYALTRAGRSLFLLILLDSRFTWYYKLFSHLFWSRTTAVVR